MTGMLSQSLLIESSQLSLGTDNIYQLDVGQSFRAAMIGWLVGASRPASLGTWSCAPPWLVEIEFDYRIDWLRILLEERCFCSKVQE